MSICPFTQKSSFRRPALNSWNDTIANQSTQILKRLGSGLLISNGPLLNFRLGSELFRAIVPDTLPISWRFVHRFIVESQESLCCNGHIYVEGLFTWLRLAALLEIDDCPALWGFQDKILAGRPKAIRRKNWPQPFKHVRKEFVRIRHCLTHSGLRNHSREF